jgi:TolB-like protein/tetratricopeptide (TPR) repeat protein
MMPCDYSRGGPYDPLLRQFAASLAMRGHDHGATLPRGGLVMRDLRAEMALQAEPAVFSFGRFVLHGRQRLLLADGAPVELGTRSFEVLLTLVEASGALVTKDAILERVWPDVSVEENNIQVQVSALRRVLGADRDWIMTIPGRGYRFTAPVSRLADAKAPAACVDPAADPPRLSILVLPFAGRGGDPAQAWFADAITDSLTTDLARALPGSTVIAQTSADTYKGRPADVREIGRAHSVRYVLEGSVLLTIDHVRVNAQLIAADTGMHLWAERFDKARHDVLQLQDEIVGRLTRSVGLQMVDAEARRAAQTAPGGDATDFVLRGHAASTQRFMTPASIATACAMYERALELEPGHPDALAGIASVRVYQVVNGYLEAEETVRDVAARAAHLAEAEAKLALALAGDPGHMAALKTRAVLLRARGSFAAAVAAAEAIIARSPGDPMAHREIGLNLLYLGRTEEAVTWFRRADVLAPADPARWSWLQGLGRALLQLGRDAEAAEVLRLALANHPNYAALHALLAAALVLSGDRVNARLEMAEFRRAEPATPIDVLARRSAVPYDATDPLYRARNERVLDGLREANAA